THRSARRSPLRPPGKRPLHLQRTGRHAEFFSAAVVLAPEPSREREPREPATVRRINMNSSEVYHKRVPFPFVEHMPFVEHFPALERLVLRIGNNQTYSAGREATVLRFRNRQGEEVKVGSVLCYEQFYPRDRK